MVHRIGQLSGLLLLLLVVARLMRLIQTGTDLPRWVPILIASAALGGLVQWLLHQARIHALISGLIMAIGGAAIFLRVIVPTTLAYGFIPTSETWPILGEELDIASRLVRYGVPPVPPEPALIGVLALLLWSLGAVYVLGVLYDRLSLMVIPSGIIYLQFAVFDRTHAGPGWMVASAIVLVLAMTALAMHRRSQIGAIRAKGGRAQAFQRATAPMIMAGVVAIVSIFGAHQASGMVSEYGNLPFRGVGGGTFPGAGIAFDRFVDLRQQIISRENALLFRATFGPEVGDAGRFYWRMETLDRFDGTAWTRGGGSDAYRPGDPIGRRDHAYRGSTLPILQRIYLDRLAGDLLPTAGIPVEIHNIDEPDSINPRSVRIGSDGSLFFPQGLRSDSNYQLLATYPAHDLDLGGLATGADGNLSPIFAAAAEAGVFNHAPSPDRPNVIRPGNLSFYTEVPEDTPSSLRGIALIATRGATTDFEKAWMLEHWLRDPEVFTYSTEVSTGHSSLDLVAWLTEPASPNFRTGYCEQFAATMALLGRILGIPSRVVWVFTPGPVTSVDGVQVVEVRDTNAHAWVEMWMDGYGWVKFDPTPGGQVNSSSILPEVDPAEYVPELPAPSNPNNPDIPDDVIDPQEPVPLPPSQGGPINQSGEFPMWLLYVVIAGLAIYSVPLLKNLRRKARLNRLQEGDITAAWEEIIDRLEDLGETINQDLTPIEFAGVTSKELVPLARSYSAAVYGGRNGAGRVDDLATVELWLEYEYDRSERLRARFNPRSLLKRR